MSNEDVSDGAMPVVQRRIYRVPVTRLVPLRYASDEDRS